MLYPHGVGIWKLGKERFHDDFLLVAECRANMLGAYQLTCNELFKSI